MEFLLILLPLALLGAVATGGGGGNGEGGDEDDGVVRSGTSEAEDIDGSSGGDLIMGGSGTDSIRGMDGNDILLGEGFEDTLLGMAGNDILLGGNADDVLDGGDGTDLLFGGADRDVLSGDAGDDVLIGGSDIDTLSGGEGDDVLSGVEITPSDLDDPDLAEVAEQLRTLVALRHGDAVADRFGDRIGRSLLSANVERPTFADGFQTPPRPDLLFGGEGSDTLFGDHGDMMIGGGSGTADLFVAVMRTNAEPVTIEDFEAEDRIEIDPDGLPSGDISFTPIDEGTLIRVGDAAVVVVNGFHDIGLLSTRVSLVPAA